MDKYLVRKDVFNELAKSFMLNADSIEKGRALPDGTVRNWKGVDYIKKNGKWIPKGGDKKAKKVEPEKTTGAKAAEDEPTKTTAPKYETGASVKLDSVEGDYKINKVDEDGSYHVTGSDGKKYHVSENHIKDSGKAENKAKEPEKTKEPGTTENKTSSTTSSATEKQLTPTYGRKQIPANEFVAAEYKKAYDDDKIDTTYAGIEEALRQAQDLPIVKRHPDFMYRLRADLKRAEEAPETVTKYRKSGSGAEAIYTPERAAIHKKIINKLIGKKKDAATPRAGEVPTFQILGGRGGSGKSTFNKKKSDAGVYHEDNVIVVDPDAIKEELANESGDGWEGWKAKAYHEESSDVAKMLMKDAMALGLNIVMDITMSNADKQIDELKMAKALGYKTGAYYMHVPKQESFKRAMKRYIESETEKGVEDYSGRLVPPDVLLGMTGNEANFDKVKEFADDWSFYDNFIPFEKDPVTNKNKYQAEKIAQKGE